MSGTIPQGIEAGPQAEAPAAAAAAPEGRPAGKRRRRGWVAASVVAALAAAAIAGWRAGLFSPDASPGAAGLAASAPATATVVRQDLSATTPVAATLGYAGSYTVSAPGGGALTWLPRVGSVIRQGQVLYRVDNGVPAVLLYGAVPDWRAMSEGTVGADVTQLNHDLVNLGFAARTDFLVTGWDYYSADTAYAVQRLEGHLGVSFPSGSLALGAVAFEPGAIRIARLAGSLGDAAVGPVLQATSDQHVVMIALDTSQESQVRAGDRVSVTLPDGTATPGVVSSVGTVATTSASSGGGTVTTIPVQVTLSHPGAAGTLDQAPVTVYLTTATARDVLAVPVTALLARPQRRYVVEVVGAGNARRYVPVTVGPVFDDNSGLVEVAGGLTPGERVVVASS